MSCPIRFTWSGATRNITNGLPVLHAFDLNQIECNPLWREEHETGPKVGPVSSLCCGGHLSDGFAYWPAAGSV